MELKMLEILNFRKFYQAIKDKTIPIKTAYHIARLNASIQTNMDFYQDSVRHIIDSYVEKDADGTPIMLEGSDSYKIKAGQETECAGALNDLQNLVVTLPDVTFTPEELGGINLSIEDLEPILPFIKE
jgi:hypothetical protein